MAETSAESARRAIRTGEHTGATGLLARGYVQANIVIVPAAYADSFALFCRANPRPCPLLATGTPGNPSLPALGRTIDIRTDVPSYRIIENGLQSAVVDDISEVWRDDLVTFALGCSFSFEHALEEAGIGVRHNELGLVNPMYTTNLPTEAVGPFAAPYVVTMRPLTPARAIRAVQITSRFPQVHGAPIHFGNPRSIGISSLDDVEFGGAVVPLYENEVPVFWACGVTSQLAVMHAKLPFCITHQPACMLITDVRNAELSIF